MKESDLQVAPDSIGHSLSRLPSAFIGSGTVIDPKALIGELDKLAELGISSEKLYISNAAHVTHALPPAD